jgi:hypothetical protein
MGTRPEPSLRHDGLSEPRPMMRPPEIVVFMHPDARSDEIAAVQVELSSAAGALKTDYLDKSRALERGHRLFSGQPEIAKQLTLELTHALRLRGRWSPYSGNAQNASRVAPRRLRRARPTPGPAVLST